MLTLILLCATPHHQSQIAGYAVITGFWQKCGTTVDKSELFHKVSNLALDIDVTFVAVCAQVGHISWPINDSVSNKNKKRRNLH